MTTHIHDFDQDAPPPLRMNLHELLRVLGYCDAASLTRMARVCWYLRLNSRREELWAPFYNALRFRHSDPALDRSDMPVPWSAYWSYWITRKVEQQVKRPAQINVSMPLFKLVCAEGVHTSLVNHLCALAWQDLYCISTNPFVHKWCKVKVNELTLNSDVALQFATEIFEDMKAVNEGSSFSSKTCLLLGVPTESNEQEAFLRKLRFDSLSAVEATEHDVSEEVLHYQESEQVIPEATATTANNQAPESGCAVVEDVGPDWGKYFDLNDDFVTPPPKTGLEYELTKRVQKDKVKEAEVIVAKKHAHEKKHNHFRKH